MLPKPRFAPTAGLQFTLPTHCRHHSRSGEANYSFRVMEGSPENPPRGTGSVLFGNGSGGRGHEGFLPWRLICFQNLERADCKLIGAIYKAR
jgi:hypothetical protein